MISSTFFVRLLSAATLVAGLSAPALHDAAAAPDTSNKGGDVRGTARADDRAGAHGDQGRDRAQANKTKAKTGKAATTASKTPK